MRIGELSDLHIKFGPWLKQRTRLPSVVHSTMFSMSIMAMVANIATLSQVTHNVISFRNQGILFVFSCIVEKCFSRY